MALAKIGNLKGPQGVQGPRGLPGMNAVPTDAAVGAYVDADDSATGIATQARVDASASPNMKSILGKHSTDLAALQMEAYVRDRVASVPSTPINCYYGYQMAARWKAAVERVRAGTGPAKILTVGDSTTAGMGSSTEATVANNASWPAVLSRLLHRNTAKSVYGLSIPPSNGHETEDNRWGVGTGWAKATIAGLGMASKGAAYVATPGSGALTFLDSRMGVNAYDVYYVTNASSSLGTFTAQVGAGAPVVVNTNAAKGISKVTVTGPAVSSSTPVSIRNTGATGNVYIIAVEPHHTTDHRIRVGNAGVSGSNSAGWVEPSGADNLWGLLNFFNVYQPDLTIIDIGINDSPGTSVADYTSRMLTIANAAHAAGSAVLFKTMVPSAPSTGRVEREGEFVQALINGLGSNYAVLDLFNHYGSWDRNNARGWMADNLHPADGLYYDEAEKVAEMLFRYSGY